MTVQPALVRTTPDRVIPYITADQYRCENTGVNTQALIAGGDQADQDAALERVIEAASKWCDLQAEQPITAQLTVEGMRTTVAGDGTLRLKPRQHPLVQVNGVSYGPQAYSMTSLTDLSAVWVEEQAIVVPLGFAGAASASGGSVRSWSGSLQLGTARPGSRVFVSVAYVAGYPVTTLALPATAGASTLTLADTTGVVPGTQLRLTQGGGPTGAGSDQASLVQEYVTVLTVTATQVGVVAPGVVTLQAPLAGAYDAGAGASALPKDIEQAGILAVTGLMKMGYGSGSLSLGAVSATVAKGDADAPGMDELTHAAAIMEFHRPVAP